MKKMLAALLALACLLGLTACDPGWARVDGEELLSNTVKIQLVEYENTAPKYYRLGRKQQACFDFDQTTLLAELDEFGFEDLINDIASYDLMVFDMALNEPIGKTLILYQSNGNMIVLFGGVHQYDNGRKKIFGQCNVYDETGKLVDYLGDISSNYVDELAERYFGSQDLASANY